MTDATFKVGDLVYCPIFSNQIGKIERRSKPQNNPYPLKATVQGQSIYVTDYGKLVPQSPVPVIYHATQKNYELLSKMYPDVEFEPPFLNGMVLED